MVAALYLDQTRLQKSKNILVQHRLLPVMAPFLYPQGEYTGIDSGVQAESGASAGRFEEGALGLTGEGVCLIVQMVLATIASSREFSTADSRFN